MTAGDVFGRLMLLEVAPRESRFWNCRGWRCRCECGKEIVTTSARLRLGQVRSCGCLRLEMLRARSTRHGNAPRRHVSREYRTWQDIKKRCYDPKNSHYRYYGGKGITLCDRWQDFSAFLEDMGPRPEGLSIDRIDGRLGYSPENCRWADAITQANNRPTYNRWLTFDGRTMTVAQWERALGLPTHLVVGRLHNGWSVERTLSTPKQ